MAYLKNFRLILNNKINFFKNYNYYRNKKIINSRNLSSEVKENGSKSSVIVYLENKKKQLTFESGELARLSDGSAVVKLGDTSVMVTAVSKSSPSSSTASFLPLVVDYKQKAAAAGRIPTNYLRRELGPSENEILTSRIIDRSVRPLFPPGYSFDTQIICNILAIDGINDPDVIAINGASASLALSDIPWKGPVGAVRIGMIDNELIINPTRYEMEKTSLNLIITATSDNLVVMLDGCANIILEQDLKKAIKIGVKECQGIIEGINKLVKIYGKPKRIIDTSNDNNENLKNDIKLLAEMKLRNIFTNYNHDKLSRDNALNELRNDVIETMKKSINDLNLAKVVEIFNSISKQIFRSLIFETDIRCDGRKLDELRNISCKVNLFKPLHGSALFQRGQTQVLCTVTLDSIDSALKMDPISMLTTGMKEKNFFLHYEFPPYATRDTGRSGPIGRREMGHGALAERGLRPIIPENYPFTIRLTSEVLESNGSSSMASVCGGSLALLDAGVGITQPAAGVAIGLITKYNDENPNHIDDYRILTDLLGIEDYLGDMDFKIAGVKKGLTAIQADIKIPGLPLKILMESITKAINAKSNILSIMNNTISSPKCNKENLPVTDVIEIPVYQRGRFLGVGASNLKKIFIQTGVSIHINDENTYSIFAPNSTALNEAKLMINQLLKEDKIPELEFGGIYTAKVVEIRDSGVMVILYPNMLPTLLHNTQLDKRLVMHPSALGIQVGQELQVKYFGRDPVSGTIRLSRKVLQTTNPTIAKNFIPQSEK